MSPEAIDRRLREVAELYRLGMMQQSAKLPGSVDENAPAADADSLSGLDQLERDDPPFFVKAL
jgi:hypothetical protein